MKTHFFATQEEFRNWLSIYHELETELIVGIYKLSSKKPSMTWPESVDQALCYGWIDGIRRSIDNESYCIRFTPRKNRSIWSTININKVEALRALGLMTPAGEKAYSLKKESRSGIYSYENEIQELDPALEAQFKVNELAWEFFNQQSGSFKKIRVHWMMSAKQEKTRKLRLEKTMVECEVLANKRKKV